MRQVVFLILLLIALSPSAIGQTEFKITYNMRFNDGYQPTFRDFEPSESLTLDQANQVFKQIKTESGIEFRYSYGGCEDRAHAISLLLNEKGIKHRKIWNFNPYYISLFNRSQQPNINDQTGTSVNGRVGWGFHVAVLLSVKESSSVRLVVFDPAVADELLPVKKWLEAQNAPTSYYTFTDPQWFSFYTIEGQKPNDENMPKNFPPLLTGDFIKNEGPNLNDMWVEEGLAVNQIGMRIIAEVIRNEPDSSQKRRAFTQLVTNIDSLTCFLRNDCKSDNGAATTASVYVDEMNKYRGLFNEIRSSWKARLDKIRKQS